MTRPLTRNGFGLTVLDADREVTCARPAYAAPTLTFTNGTNGACRIVDENSSEDWICKSSGAVWYYLTFGYWTGVNSALTCWAVAAGLFLAP